MEENTTTVSYMKPFYDINQKLMCGIIKYHDKIFLMDLKDRDRITNLKKSFVFANSADTYPSFSLNYKRVNYLEFIFKYSQQSAYYFFKNGNPYDMRHCNVEIFHSYHKYVNENYNVLEYIPGHYSALGQDANIMKNPMWRIIENGEEYILMYCEKDTLCKLCPVSYQKILDFETVHNEGKKCTFFTHHNGYVCSTNNLYIHQIIMNLYGNGKGTKNTSVDHIDQNPLNNTIQNLRVATRKQQEDNTKGIQPGTKRSRQSIAQNLPDGIHQEMLKKYVVFYKDYADKEKTIQREYFRVEGHPKLGKLWSTTKSKNVSIIDKLAQANKVVEDLEHDIYPVKEGTVLPKYFSLVTMRDKPHLVYERRLNDQRLNLKMVLPEAYDLDDQVEKLMAKIKAKYENITF